MTYVKQNRKITTEQATEIRHKAANGVTQQQLAIEYSVSTGTIWQILHNISHKECVHDVNGFPIYDPVKRIANQEQKITNLENANSQLEIKVQTLRTEVDTLTHRVLELELQNTALSADNVSLKRDVNELRMRMNYHD